jgi:hypothetical protein
LEETSEIEIPDNDVRKIRRVQDALVLIGRLEAQQKEKVRRNAEKKKR